MNAHAPGSPDSCSEGWARDEVARLLARVTRPGRYTGGEFNLRLKPGASPRIVLSYPDVYEIGISNPGLQILYTQLNDATPAAAERAYCPWPDMAGADARPRRAALDARDHGAGRRLRPLGLHAAARAHVHERARDARSCGRPAARRESAGRSTPSCSAAGRPSPTPGRWRRSSTRSSSARSRHRLDEIVEALAAPSRALRLRALAAVPGMWLPGVSDRPARRQVFTAFSSTPPVLRPVVPVLEAVHDRAIVEVMRGCTAGCRFCQAGMWYRPVRERPVDLVVEAAETTAARDRLRRGLAALAQLVRLLGRRGGAHAHPRPAAGRARVSALAAHRFRRGEPRALRRRPARLRDAGAGGRHPGAARRHQQGRRRRAVRARPCGPPSRAGSPASSSTS